MKINGQPTRSIRVKPGDDTTIQIIDQRFLPHKFVVEDLRTSAQAADAIREMHVRGAPLIGITAAYGLYLACREAQGMAEPGRHLEAAAKLLRATRPTAINLNWAIDLVLGSLVAGSNWAAKTKIAFDAAGQMADEDVETNRQIGLHGLKLIEEIAERKNGQPVHILTHCNAGWLATVDYGTATSPMYHAHDQGIDIHVWVDETRPRNQGALTAWELGNHGIPHTYIADNAGGHLMQHGMVDICFVGSDRTTVTGDVANKIGTYLKALAAHDNGVPFYVCLPGSTFDWTLRDGLRDIPIETRSESEITHIQGLHEGTLKKVQVSPAGSPAVNYGFDVTPAKYVTGLVTERGVCAAEEREILRLFPEYQPIA